MDSQRTSGFQDLVMFLARPKIVAIGLIIALLGHYVFRSSDIALLVLVPIGAAVALVSLGIAIGLITRILAFFVYPNYRMKVLSELRAAWRGK